MQYCSAFYVTFIDVGTRIGKLLFSFLFESQMYQNITLKMIYLTKLKCVNRSEIIKIVKYIIRQLHHYNY